MASAGNDLKNLFIFNAINKDSIVVDGVMVKKAGAPSPAGQIIIDGLRVSFMDDFRTAVAQGMTDMLDGIALNADDIRGQNGARDYYIYGRARHVSVTVT